jgi:hypothetical protein
LAVTQEGILKVTNGFPFGFFFRTTTMVRYIFFGSQQYLCGTYLHPYTDSHSFAVKYEYTLPSFLLQITFENIQSCRIHRDCKTIICGSKPDVVVIQEQRKTNKYGRETNTVIQAKIDFTNNWIPFIMDTGGFVQLVNVMMRENKKEGNDVSAVEMELMAERV